MAKRTGPILVAACLLAGGFSAAQAAIPASERAALIALYAFLAYREIVDWCGHSKGGEIALASIKSAAKGASDLTIEHTVEFERCRVPVRIVDTPFFDPPRKRKP